jgi:hypothetical protein
MDRKIGEGHAGAMFRLGLKELRNAINPSRESVADQEIGVYGTLTQGEIADARGGPGQGPEQETRQGEQQEARLGNVSLDDVRAYAKELSQAEERSRDQGREQAQERDPGGHER